MDGEPSTLEDEPGTPIAVDAEAEAIGAELVGSTDLDTGIFRRSTGNPSTAAIATTTT